MTDDRNEAQKVIDACAVASVGYRSPSPDTKDFRILQLEESLAGAHRRIEDLEKENERLRIKVAIDQRIREMEAELAMLKSERKAADE